MRAAFEAASAAALEPKAANETECAPAAASVTTILMPRECVVVDVVVDEDDDDDAANFVVVVVAAAMALSTSIALALAFSNSIHVVFCAECASSLATSAWWRRSCASCCSGARGSLADGSVVAVPGRQWYEETRTSSPCI